jgi:hypothetical protein
MSKRNLKINTIPSVLALAIVVAASGRADTLTLITSQGSQQQTDSIIWSQVGVDNTVLAASGTLKTANGTTATVSLAAANAVISVVCTATPCSWTGHGFTAGQSVVWTSDAGNGGSGPLSLSFPSPVAGGGAYIQADGPGAFTAVLSAYNGSTLLGSVTVPSNSAGDATYIGVIDQTGSNITKLVWSLSKVGQGLTNDFGLGTVSIKAGSPVATLTPTSLTFASQVVGTTSSAQSVTLKNTGTATLNITGVVFTGDFFSPSKTCGTTLAAGASCTISVAFTPKATGTRTGTLTVSDNAAGGKQTVSFTGTAIAGAPAATLSATSVSFAAQLLNTKSGVKTVTLKNTGTAILNIKSITPTGDFAVTNNCNGSLAAGASCTLTITFTPKAIGARTGAVTLLDNAGTGSQKISLTGTGTSLKVSATSLTFAATTVGTASAAQNVALTNVGTAAIALTSIALTGTDPGDYTKTQTCGTTLNAGASCTVSVTFKPKATGSRPATLSIANNSGYTPRNVALNGTGK